MAYNAINNWTGLGRLTADPELKQTNSGVSVVGFCLAIDRPFADKDGNRKTDFIQCTAWRGNADFIAKWAHKGDVVGVTGAIQSRKYEDGEGKHRTAYEVLVNEISICSGKKGDGSAPVATQKTETESIDVAAEDEDLPF